MKTTPKMDIPQKDTPKNVEDLSEVKRTSKCRHILLLHYTHCCTSFKYVTHIILLISLLPYAIQKCFCTLDRPMDPAFQMKYIPNI